MCGWRINKTQIVEKALERVVSISVELVNLSYSSNEHMVFVDESQNRNGDRVLAAAIVPRAIYPVIESFWEITVAGINGNPETYDLKHNRLRQGNTPSVASVLLAAARLLGVRFVLVVRPGSWSVRDKLRNEEMLAEDLFERVAQFCSVKAASCIVYADKSGWTQARAFIGAFDKIRRKLGREVMTGLEFVHSNGNPGIGLVDIAAGEVGAYLASGEPSSFSRAVFSMLLPWRGAIAKPVPTRTFYLPHFSDFQERIFSPLKSLWYEKGSFD